MGDSAMNGKEGANGMPPLTASHSSALKRPNTCCTPRASSAAPGRLCCHPPLQGKFDEAKPLLERALVILRGSLGEGNPHTTMVLDTLKELDEREVSTATATVLFAYTRPM